jgi:hypothetical protein
VLTCAAAYACTTEVISAEVALVAAAVTVVVLVVTVVIRAGEEGGGVAHIDALTVDALLQALLCAHLTKDTDGCGGHIRLVNRAVTVIVDPITGAVITDRIEGDAVVLHSATYTA